MLINEIEIAGSSISLKCWAMKVTDVDATFDTIMKKADMFSIETELPGFHDCDCENAIIRGFYSVVIPFEIEHLVEGITTKTLFKRIESCEFIISEKLVLTFGKSGPMKLLGTALSALTGEHVDLVEFEFHHLNQLQERMTNIKSIVLTNPKEKEVRRARLAGHMENYTEYNIIDPRNHGIDSVAGLIDTPLGPMTITVGKKGSIRLNVKKGLIMTIECLEWILDLITSETAPKAAGAQQPVF
ncbi:MAG: hypothetical protein PHD82_01630 [Candidatus Riflebacteria bacterium]|jgi:hypothetical protein|nr:hypothetical protein [Candidatus Riflebacteria bacterium]